MRFPNHFISTRDKNNSPEAGMHRPEGGGWGGQIAPCLRHNNLCRPFSLHSFLFLSPYRCFITFCTPGFHSLFPFIFLYFVLLQSDNWMCDLLYLCLSFCRLSQIYVPVSVCVYFAIHPIFGYLFFTGLI